MTGTSDDELDAIRGYQPPSEGGGLFLKLSDGQTVKVRLASLPVIYENIFHRGDEVSVSTRFGFVVWNHDENRAQIWETNAATYGQQISPLLDDEDYGDWRTYDVKISRMGEKLQTKYTVRPGAQKYELSIAQKDSVLKIDIIGQLQKSDNAQRVMWLSDYRKMKEESSHPAGGKQTDPEDEPVIDDIPDGPINLDEIPF